MVPRAARQWHFRGAVAIQDGCAGEVPFAFGVNGCIPPGDGKQAPSSMGSAPRAAEVKENVSHRVLNEGKPASSQGESLGNVLLVFPLMFYIHPIPAKRSL